MDGWIHRMAQQQLTELLEWVGICGGHSLRLQNSMYILLVGSFTSSLNWLRFCFLLLHKRGPNRHVPVSLPNLWIVVDRWPFQTYTWRRRWFPARPGPPGSHHITKGAHTCHFVGNYCQVCPVYGDEHVSCMDVYICIYVCMMNYTLLEFKHKHAWI